MKKRFFLLISIPFFTGCVVTTPQLEVPVVRVGTPTRSHQNYQYDDDRGERHRHDHGHGHGHKHRHDD